MFYSGCLCKGFKGFPQHSGLTLAECRDQEEYFYYNNRFYVPDLPALNIKLFEDYHASPILGHPGLPKTYKTLRREYYRPYMV